MRRRTAAGQGWAKRNGDFICIAVVAGLFTIFGYLMYCDTVSPPRRSADRFNFGFGHRMTCEPVGLGEPVCTASPR